jgi:hypothetical protein
VGGLETFAQLSASAERHGQRLVRPGIAQMRAGLDPDAGVDALASTSARASSASSGQSLFRLFDLTTGRIELDLPHRADIGEPHAIGRQDAREGVDEHRLHAQRIGDEAGMLPARAAEACSAYFVTS